MQSSYETISFDYIVNILIPTQIAKSSFVFFVKLNKQSKCEIISLLFSSGFVIFNVFTFNKTFLILIYLIILLMTKSLC